MSEQTFAPVPVTGYRSLTQAEVDLMNIIKEHARDVGHLVARLRRGSGSPDFDQRWVAIGETHLQQGFMALIRAVARPTTF